MSKIVKVIGHTSSKYAIVNVNNFDQSMILGRFDGGLLDRRGGATPVKIILGRYQFDKNPLIGSLAGINAWNR